MKSILRPLIIGMSVAVIAIGASVYASQIAAAPQEQQAYAKYHSDRWHFSLAVPADMTYAEYDNDGGQQEIQFSNGLSPHIPLSLSLQSSYSERKSHDTCR